MNALEFFLATGWRAENDDLERANCPRAGEIGHVCCGVCELHGKPIFKCPECFRRAGSGDVKRIPQ